MEEKKSVKISLSTFFLLLAIIVIIVMALYIFTEKINFNKEIADLEANATNTSGNVENNTINLKTGNYTVNEVKEDEGGAGSGERATDVIFTFDIINDNKLKLSNIDINDTDNEKLVYKDGLTIGMTYSIK